MVLPKDIKYYKVCIGKGNNNGIIESVFRKRLLKKHVYIYNFFKIEIKEIFLLFIKKIP